MTDLARLTAVLEAEITRWSSGLDAATEKLNKFADGVTDTLKDVAGAFGLYLSVDALAEWGKSLVEQDANLDRFSQETGVAVEQLSALEFALESGGVSADKMSVIFRDLQKNISAAAGDATSNSAIAFKLLGINVDDANGNLKDSQQILSDVADKFQTMQDGANKTALAVQLFGKNGESLIPTLNKGADGIAALEDQAAKLGATVSGTTAAAAEKFETDVNNLGVAVKEGLGQRILQDLMPALDGLTDSFKTSGDTGKQFDAVASTIADGLKVLAAGALYAVNFIDDTGKAIGGVAAAAVEFIHGNFSQAKSIISDTFDDIDKTDAAFLEKEKALFKDAGDSIVATTADTAKKVAAPNLSAAEAAEKAAEAAIKQLQSFDQGIRSQIAALQDGGGEAAKYEEKLQSMVKAIAAAGPAGAALAVTIQQDIDAFKKLSDDKTVTDGLAKINEALQKATGDEGAAAVAKLDIEFNKFITTERQAADNGDAVAAANLRMYDSLVKATVATADFNADTKKSAEQNEALSLTLAHLKIQFDEGALGQADYQKAVADAQTETSKALEKTLADMELIAGSNATPQQQEQIDKLKLSIAQLQDQAGKAGQEFKQAIGNDAVNALTELETGTASASKAFGDFLTGIETELLKMANQKLVDAAFGALINGTGGGSGAGIFGTIAGLFAGGKADGGDVVAGNAYLINENTPNSEYFIPKVSGQVVPSSKTGGGMTVRQYFTIQAPTGSVSRQTQNQIAAQASRSLATASRRNN